MVYEIGYNEPIEGQEVYRAYENGKQTRSHKTWEHILERCYSDKLHAKEPTYKDVVVAEEWLNYQVFAKWYDDNYYEVEGQRMELDKDLLSGNSKIYSPNTCIFLPKVINGILQGAKGYYFNAGKYQANVRYKGKLIYLGLFETEEEARYTYRLNKQLVIYMLAEEYKEYLPLKVYQALMNYRMDVIIG